MRYDISRVLLGRVIEFTGRRSPIVHVTVRDNNVDQALKALKKKMQRALKNIQSGKFAGEWIKESDEGCPNFKQLRKEGAQHQIEKVGKRLRNLMPWLKKRDIKGSQASYH